MREHRKIILCTDIYGRVLTNIVHLISLHIKLLTKFSKISLNIKNQILKLCIDSMIESCKS